MSLGTLQSLKTALSFPLFLKQLEKHVYQTKVELGQHSEMITEEIQLLVYLLNTLKPKKMLEVGVSAGGTTYSVLNALPHSSKLFSVDIAAQYYYDNSHEIGFVASEIYDAQKHPKWERFFGYDVSEPIDKIGRNIDFFLLDTTHRLPGEILSFLVVLPYLKNNACFMVHDICLHTNFVLNHKKNPTTSNATFVDYHTYCTTLLFAAISSNTKILLPPPAPLSNIGAMFIDKQQVYKDINPIFHLLFIPWAYLPGDRILNSTRKIIQKHYSDLQLRLFDEAVEYNLKIAGNPEKKILDPSDD